MLAPGVTLLTLLPFILLLIAVLGLWVHRVVWMGALTAAVMAGYFTGAIRGLAAVWIGLLLVLALGFARAKTGQSAALKVVAGLAFFVFALVMGLELLPGMPRSVVIDPVRLSPDAIPWGLALAFPKVVGGIFILGIIHEGRVGSWRELGAVLRRTAPVFALTVVVVMICALLLGYVRFDAKWTSLFFAWALANLFFTCLSEEAFFRGFLQNELGRIGGDRESMRVIAWLFAAGLFGLVHLGGGWKFAVAATIAGLGYGWAYHRTRRVEAGMAVHFGLNASHFLLFTYPALA